MSALHPPQRDSRAPHPTPPAPALDTTEAVRRARQQATVVTCAAAVVPTVLAMQGMASLAVDLLGFGLPLAIALAGFLELALVSFALLTRASALAGRPGGVDAIAVWVVSATSGMFSGAHELIGHAVGGTRAWEVDPGSLLAAGVRLAAPLVAALLWERVLTAARREHEARSLVEVRRDRRLIAVAVAALTVRQLDAEHRPGRRLTARMRRARRTLQRKHVAALRMVGPGQDLLSVLAAVGAVDVLPAATIVQSLDAVSDGAGALSDTRGAARMGPRALFDTPSDTRGAARAVALALSDRVDTGSDTPGTGSSVSVRLSDAVSDTAGALSDARGVAHVAPLALSDAMSDTSDAAVATVLTVSDRVDTGSDTFDVGSSTPVRLSDAANGLSDIPTGATVDLSDAVSDRGDTGSDGSDIPTAAPVHLSDRLSDTRDQLAIAVDLVRRDPQVAGSRIAAVMRGRGHNVTDRTGLRWRVRAAAHLAAAAV